MKKYCEYFYINDLNKNSSYIGTYMEIFVYIPAY